MVNQVSGLPSDYSVTQLRQKGVIFYPDDALNKVNTSYPVYTVVKSHTERIQYMLATLGLPTTSTFSPTEIYETVLGDPATIYPPPPSFELLRVVEEKLGLFVPTWYNDTLFTLLEQIEKKLSEDKRATSHQLLPRLEQAEEALIPGIQTGNRSILQRLWTLGSHVA